MCDSRVRNLVSAKRSSDSTIDALLVSVQGVKYFFLFSDAFQAQVMRTKLLHFLILQRGVLIRGTIDSYVIVQCPKIVER